MIQIQSETRIPTNPTVLRETKETDLCILLVEDDDGDAYLIERALTALPNIGGIIRACDGVEALTLIECGTVAPDVALIDLHMPRRNGFQLLADFAALDQASFPMVVLTSSTAPRDAARSRFRGATRVLTKPDSVEALEGLLAMAIESARTGITLPRRSRATPSPRGGFDNAPQRRGAKKA